MKTSRSSTVIALVGFLALTGTQVSFGQATPAPAGAAGAAQGPQPVAADAPLPAAGAQPLPAAGLLPDPSAAAQPLPAAPPLQPDPAAAAQPLPAAPVQPAPAAGTQAVPVAGVPSLSLIRGSHIIGSRAVLVGGVVLGRVQDMLSVAGSGEYVLVANPSGFVMIPRSLAVFEPGPRILQVNMTFAQVAELPRLLQLGQLNRPFLERVHTFFGSARGQAILRNSIVRNGRTTRPTGGLERRAETRPQGGGERRAETRTAGKPVGRPQTRPEPRPENGPEVRR
jgi:hypothetical protein